jgi:hypothetical protein
LMPAGAPALHQSEFDSEVSPRVGKPHSQGMETRMDRVIFQVLLIMCAMAGLLLAATVVYLVMFQYGLLTGVTIIRHINGWMLVTGLALAIGSIALVVRVLSPGRST